MYGMKMQNDNGSVREATIGEKVILAPVVGIISAVCWFIAKKVEYELKQGGDKLN